MGLQKDESKDYLSDDACALLQKLGLASSSDERHKLILAVSETQDPSVTRILLEIFEYSMWRSTKKAIFSALGRCRNERATQFLIRYVKTSDDLPLASEAVLALGHSGMCQAGEFLVKIASKPSHPLQRHAIIGLAYMPLFPCLEELLAVLFDPNCTDAIAETTIMAIGRRRDHIEGHLLANFLQDPWSTRVKQATILTLGRIGNPSDIENLLKHATLGFMATELLSDAKENIKRRQWISLEEAILKILECPEDDLRQYGFNVLKEINNLGQSNLAQFESELPLSLLILAKSIFFEKSKCLDDLNCLVSNESDSNDQAILLRLHYSRSFKETSDFLKSVPDEFLLKMSCFIELKGPMNLLKRYFEDGVSLDLQIKAINALVWQNLLASDDSLQKEIEDFLLKLAYKGQSEELSLRLIRALGQLGCTKQNFQKLLSKALAGHDGEISSALYCLPSLEADWPQKLLHDHLVSLLKQPKVSSSKIIKCLRTIGQCSQIDKNLPIGKIPESLRHECAHDILKILSVVICEDLKSFIVSYFSSPKYELQILAITAAKNYRWNLETFLPLLTHADASLRGRALDSLCFALAPEDHGAFLDWFKDHLDQRDFLLKVFSSFNPARSWVSAWQRFMASELKSANVLFADEKIRDAATAMHDRLEIEVRWDLENNDDRDSHAIDLLLKGKISEFPRLSKATKSVLRNAELTWSNPAIFNDTVDKSTMIVQYTKSIDLFLQEKVGSLIFSEHNGLLAKLQSRLLRYSIDRNASSSEIIQRLQIASPFSSDNFPMHKMFGLCELIETGRFMRDQYRAIDGVRAWAILLMLFARKFSYKGQEYEPILKCFTPDNKKMSTIAFDLNWLQEYRNTAAHRGTNFDQNDLEKIRQKSFHLLNSLAKALLGSDQSKEDKVAS